MREVRGLDDAGPQCREIVAAAQAGRLCAWIGRLTHVEVGGSGRIHLEPQLGGFARRERAQNPFGGRRAADVAETDEQDPQGILSGAVAASLQTRGHRALVIGTLRTELSWRRAA